MYVCMSIHTYIYIYIHIHTYIYLYKWFCRGARPFSAHFWAFQSSKTPHLPSKTQIPGVFKTTLANLASKTRSKTPRLPTNPAQTGSKTLHLCTNPLSALFAATRKHSACRQIRLKPVRKHCTCRQIHFEAFSRPLENTAPADKSEPRDTFEDTWTLRGAIRKRRTCRQIQHFRFTLNPLSSKWLENTAPVHKSGLRGHFHRGSKGRKHRTCAQIRFAELQKCTTIVKSEVPRFKNTAPVHKCKL